MRIENWFQYKHGEMAGTLSGRLGRDALEEISSSFEKMLSSLSWKLLRNAAMLAQQGGGMN